MAWVLKNLGSRGRQWETDGGALVADIFIPFCVQAVVKGHTHSGEELLHVFDAKAASALPTGADVHAIATAVAAWVNDVFVPDVVRTVEHVDEVICTSRAELNGPEEVVSIDMDGGRGPSLGDQPLPNEVTLSIKKNTGITGRAFRGRFFIWPFWQQDTNAFSNDANTITGDFAALLLEKYDLLRSGLATSGNPLGVASDSRSVITPVKSLSLSDLTVDSQRRRGPGRGA